MISGFILILVVLCVKNIENVLDIVYYIYSNICYIIKYVGNIV